MAFKCCNKVFVLNNDDKDFFVNKKYLKEQKCVVINGIGIDVNEWPQTALSFSKKILMISRLIKSKGVYDFCEIAKTVRLIDPTITFYLAGAEFEIKRENLSPYIDQGDIIYLGNVNNIKDIIHDFDIVVLPSYYREGLPRSLLEAMATGRPVIAYNNVGSNVAVIDSYNGYLIEKGNIQAFAEKILQLTKDTKTSVLFAENSRQNAVDFFSSSIINKIIYNILKEEIC